MSRPPVLGSPRFFRLLCLVVREWRADRRSPRPVASLGDALALRDVCVGRSGCPVCGGSGVRCCAFGADR